MGSAMADPIVWYPDVKTLGDFVSKERAEAMRPQGAE